MTQDDEIVTASRTVRLKPQAFALVKRLAAEERRTLATIVELALVDRAKSSQLLPRPRQ